MQRRDLWILKCHVLYQLAECHGALQDIKSQTECLQQGLEMCQKLDTVDTAK